MRRKTKLDDIPDRVISEEVHIDPYMLNFGLQNSASRGVVRLVLEMRGEVVESADPHIGLLHRGVEKLIEHKTYMQAMPYFGRLDYVASMNQEHCFALAVEKLLGITVPRRAQYIRVMFCEIGRILSHIFGITAYAADIGVVTPSLWGDKEREKGKRLYERVSGALIHANYFCVGGVVRDLPEGLLDEVLQWCRGLTEFLCNLENLLNDNRILQQRTVYIWVVSTEKAQDFGFSGAMLRGSGIAWDLRKSQPYDVYEEMDFDIPIGKTGDCYARYLVRVAEIYESIKIIKQCVKEMPEGLVRVNDYKVTPPPRDEIESSMEAMIHHFKLFTEGYHVPAGETYTAVESPKGEFGVYLVSDGTNKPYRCHVRASGFAHLQALDYMCKGHQLADIISIMGSMDIVSEEIDR